MEENRYSSMGMNDLVLYAMLQIDGDIKALEFEDIAAACFLLFPLKFAMEKYKDWPDAVRVNKRVVDLRSLGFITGNNTAGYLLAISGKERAMVTMNKLKLTNSGKNKSRRATSPKASQLINMIQNQDSFQRFLHKREKAEITEGEFRRLLSSPIGTAPRKIRQNLEHVKSLITSGDKEKEIHDFLKFCEQQFSALMKKQSTSTIQEGMLKKKI